LRRWSIGLFSWRSNGIRRFNLVVMGVLTVNLDTLHWARNARPYGHG
jgi:hypothetical protein